MLEKGKLLLTEYEEVCLSIAEAETAKQNTEALMVEMNASLHAAELAFMEADANYRQAKELAHKKLEIANRGGQLYLQMI